MYKDKLLGELPEIDLVVGSSDFPKLPGLLTALDKNKRRLAVSRKPGYIYDGESPRLFLTPRHYAYVKIAEGCSNLCSYCVIPRLKGSFRSRSSESVVNEIEHISGSKGLKEVVLLGQDTTMFGTDRRGAQKLPELLKKICGLKNNVEWVRILYTHPGHYSRDLINTMRQEDKICKYLDLPIQHISDRILKAMNRGTTKKQIIELIDSLRNKIPGLVLRTSVIVGFPGETDSDFTELLRFLNDVKFERLGAFVYSKEDHTPASKLCGMIPDKIKMERYDSLMASQRVISERLNRRLVGRTLKVLIDERPAPGEFIGRTEGDAPEVDCAVHVSGKGVKTGEFYKVRIMGFMEYDLIGEAL
jgi:ribosomal protein S12 methylthiotransferase